jgi:alpha-glucosidase
MWAGDQNVDWSLDDGLPSVIPAALSLGLTGHGLHHSDIGGFTSIYGVKRTKELFMRWVELATFSPVMRTHEGNRPAENWQFDSDNETLLHLAKMTKIHKILKPYLKDVVFENAERGIPVMRPLFLHYENDKESYNEQYEYLLGRDVLVAPVYTENVTEWPVYLPPDNWIHLFSGEKFKDGGLVVVSSPLGEPPVFYREGSKYSNLFEEISKIK